MLLDVWSITSDIAIYCTLCGACCVIIGGAISAAGVGVGSDCMILAYVRRSIGTCITCSSPYSMRYGYVFWYGVDSPTLDTRRSFTGTLFCCFVLHACVPLRLFLSWVNDSIVVLL